MTTLESLLAEAASTGLYVQSLCENYWNQFEPRWTCWLRHHDGISATFQTQAGSGSTAAAALNAALNAQPTNEPPAEFSSYETPTLDTILNLKPDFKLDFKRRALT